ncbi:hypothetical protein QOT17_003177 [Balamuthia mandrillaris]
MEALPLDLTGCAEAVPAALQELANNQQTLSQIFDHCKGTLKDSGSSDIAQTKKFVSDALENVVYHVHNVGLQIANFLEVQNVEMESLDLRIRSLSQRMKQCHESTAVPEKQGMEVDKGYQKMERKRQLGATELPPSAQPLPRFQRGPINMDALSSLGSQGVLAASTSSS